MRTLPPRTEEHRANLSRAKRRVAVRPAIDRFTEKYTISVASCWVWTGAAAGRQKRAKFYFDFRQGYAARFSYSTFVGPIPPDVELHHLCGDTMCVNPAHLQPLRPEEHHRVHARLTCKRGHPLTPENRTGAGCKQCHAQRAREARRRAASA